MKKTGRQSTNIDDQRGGQSFGSALMGGLRQIGTAFRGREDSRSIQEISNAFTNARPPAGQALPQSADYHQELRKGF